MIFFTPGNESPLVYRKERSDEEVFVEKYAEDHLTCASYISAETLREQKIEWDKMQKVA